MERLKALLDRLLVVVYTATRLCPAQQPLRHRLVRHLEVQRELARDNLKYDTGQSYKSVIGQRHTKRDIRTFHIV